MDYRHVDDEALEMFARLARAYCTLVEQYAAVDLVEFLQGIHTHFGALYVGGLRLPSHNILFDEDVDSSRLEDEQDDEETPIPFRDPGPDRITPDRAPDVATISAKLGETWFYREVFDPHEPADREVTGSLADDITDTYLDLSVGLRKWDRGETGAALWEWRFSFETHWGKHVSSGLRALHARSAWHDLPWPRTGRDAQRRR